MAKAIDKKLQDFVGLLHRPLPPMVHKRRPWRLVTPIAAVLMLAGLGAALWFPWLGLGSYFKTLPGNTMASVSPAAQQSGSPNDDAHPRTSRPYESSWPGLSLPSTSSLATEEHVDARDKPTHDDRGANEGERSLSGAVSEPEILRALPPAPPPPPSSEGEPAALPPQETPRVLASQPPLPPVRSLQPDQPVSMVVAAAAAAEPPQIAAAVPAWIRNAVLAPARDARPRIAVVIDDVGLDRQRTARAIALPAPLTLSFLPYAMDLPRQTQAAHKAGHELLVHVPMEPLGKNSDAGPSPLDVGMGDDQVLQRLRWDLARFEGYVGINNHMGSRFTSDAGALEPVMRELHERGLLFVDSRTVAHSAGSEVAGKYGVPHAARDVFLDDEISTPAIAARLGELERVARHTGSAIAIGHPHDQTLDALKGWLRDVPSKGFVLVPVSAIVKERAGEG
jgi:uncharacterized protein